MKLLTIWSTLALLAFGFGYGSGRELLVIGGFVCLALAVISTAELAERANSGRD